MAYWLAQKPVVFELKHTPSESKQTQDELSEGAKYGE